MNLQLTDHGYLHDEDNFYEAAEEFIMDEANEVGDNDISEPPPISSGGHVTEHSESQRLPLCPEEEDECTTLTEQSVDLHVPKGSSSDILSSQEQENLKSLVEEKEASIPSQNLQDQQKQQPPPVGRLCSDHDGKIMAEDLLEHQTESHDDEPPQEACPEANFHSYNDIESTEALRRPLNSEAEEKKPVEKVIPPNNNRDIDENGDMRFIQSDSFYATKILLSVIVSTFALMMVRKLLQRRS